MIKAYDGDGKLILSVPHKDGLIDGTMITNEGRYTETKYVSGVRNGIEKTYYDLGKVVRYETPYENDLIQGTEINYYKTGPIQRKTTYLNDLQHGKDVRFYMNGALDYEHYYLYDKQVTEEEYRKHELIEELGGLNE